MRFGCIVVLQFLVANAQSQTARFKNESLGSFSARIENHSLLTENGASLTNITNISATVHSSAVFMMKEMKFFQGMFLIPSKHGTILSKIEYNHLGALHQNNIRIAFSKKLAVPVSVSVSFGYEN